MQAGRKDDFAHYIIPDDFPSIDEEDKAKHYIQVRLKFNDNLTDLFHADKLQCPNVPGTVAKQEADDKQKWVLQLVGTSELGEDTQEEQADFWIQEVA